MGPSGKTSRRVSAGDLDDGPDAVAVVEHKGSQVVAEEVGDLVE